MAKNKSSYTVTDAVDSIYNELNKESLYGELRSMIKQNKEPMTLETLKIKRNERIENL